MKDTVIKVENLSKLYDLGEIHKQTNSFRDKLTSVFKKDGRFKKDDTIWALKNVSFEVKRGEVLGIIGRNGAGKSTLLKILSRITKPTGGKAWINGRVGSLLEVGTGFHPELTGRENIYLNGAVLGMKKAEIKRRFDEIVEFAEVEKFIDTPVKRYSSGMYVRLAFAVAAHLEPEILLVDEVLAVGDNEFQKKCLGKMGDVAKEGRTVLFVSHNISAVKKLCDNALLLNAGQIEFKGPASQCVKIYLQDTNATGTTEVNTTLFERPEDLGKSLRFSRIRLLSTNGRDINLNDPFGIELQFQAFEPVRDVAVGMAIDTLDAVRIFDSRTTDVYSPIKLLQPGEYTIQVHFKNNVLMPGDYTISVGAGSDIRGKGFDLIEHVLRIRILTKTSGVLSFEPIREGFVRVDAQWTKPSRRGDFLSSGDS